jgi:hypothetical protein
MNNAQLKYSYSWVDANSNALVVPQQVINMPYKVSAKGAILVPDGAASGAEFDVPFTGAGQGAVCVMLWNLTGQELNAAWGGNFAPHVPPGGMVAFTFPLLPAAGLVTGYRFFLTQTQVGEGRIAYFFAGN